MREEGTVVEVSGSIARIEIEAKPHCSHCKICDVGREGERILETENTVGASPGDKVILEVPPGQIIKTSLVVYGVPLLGLVGGVALGYLVAGPLGIPGKKDLLGIILAAAGLAAALALVALYDRRLTARGTQRVKIVEKR